MKRLSLLKKLSILGASAAAVAPIALTATSCTPTSMRIDAFDFNQLVDFEGKQFEPSNTTKSFRSLLYGNNSTYEGNYILIVGSNMFDTTCEFFTKDKRVRNREKWYSDEYIFDSYLWYGAQLAYVDPAAAKGITNFGIYTAIDFFDGHVYDKTGHEIIVYSKTEGIQDRIGPFDKWSKLPGLIEQTKIFNKSEDNPLGKYEWDDESVTEDDYIREDDYAKAYRAFCQRGAIIYPKQEPEPDPEGSNERTITFDTADNNNTSLMLVFKDGVLANIETIPSSAEAFQQKIVDNFKKDEEEPEPEPEAII